MESFKRLWYTCPYCGKKLAVMTANAVSRGVFIKCKGCKREIEIKV